MSEKSIVELEIKLAFQEDLLESLNHIITEQQRQIQCLENSFTLLHQRQQNLAESIESTQEDNQPPPHY